MNAEKNAFLSCYKRSLNLIFHRLAKYTLLTTASRLVLKETQFPMPAKGSNARTALVYSTLRLLAILSPLRFNWCRVMRHLCSPPVILNTIGYSPRFSSAVHRVVFTRWGILLLGRELFLDYTCFKYCGLFFIAFVNKWSLDTLPTVLPWLVICKLCKSFFLTYMEGFNMKD